MLLNEIIEQLSSSTGNLTDALLKTKVLLHQIGRKDLVSWVNSELTGYPDDNVPPYRVVSMEVHGHVASIAWEMRDYLMPISHLKPGQRKNLTSNNMTSSIHVIEESVKSFREKSGGMRCNLPTEATALFKKVILPGVNVISVWCNVNMGDVENILAEVRSRLLDFALELRDIVGADADPVQFKEKADKADTAGIFQTAIYGSGNTVVLGANSTQTVTVTNSKGDIESLRDVLAGIGVPDSDLDELAGAITEDERNGDTPVISDGKTGNWFTRLLGRAGKGGINVAVDLLSSTIVKALGAYNGMAG